MGTDIALPHISPNSLFSIASNDGHKRSEGHRSSALCVRLFGHNIVQDAEEDTDCGFLFTYLRVTTSLIILDPQVIHKNFKISRIRAFYMRKVKFTQDSFDEKLGAILSDFPILDVSPVNRILRTDNIYYRSNRTCILSCRHYLTSSTTKTTTSSRWASSILLAT